MLLRFAVSPLWETVAALRALATPGRSSVHHRWTSWGRPRLDALGPDRTLLTTLATLPVVPEFLIPTPSTRSLDMDAALAGLLDVASPTRMAAALPDDPRLRPLVDDPDAFPAVRERLRQVHEAVIAPLWPRLEGVLQGDIERRGRHLVDEGAPAVLTDLHPDVDWHPDGVELSGRPIPTGERDLVLVPSAFTWPDVYLRDGPCRVAICYPAHGFGSLWERREAPTTDALSRLLGPTRARLLQGLDQPSTVSQIADHLGITLGAASQHLSVLRAAGLAVSRREGRKVVSLRTALGLALIKGVSP